VPNLAKADDVLRFCADQREAMEANWRRNGRFEANGYSFCAYVFATHAPSKPPGAAGAHPETWQPGRKLDRVEAKLCQLPPLLRLLDNTQSHTATFEPVLRAYARACKAVGVLFCGEGWFVKMEAASDEEALRKRAELPRSLEDAPGRIERLFMELQHQDAGIRRWFCTIQSDPRRLDRWEASENVDQAPFSRFHDIAGLKRNPESNA
jgi:hypothetical protein